MFKQLFLRMMCVGLATVGLGANLSGAVAQAQTQAKWPERSVSFIVPFPPGGPVDTTARLTAQPLSALWSVTTPIENKAGAGGIVGAQAAAKAAPDFRSVRLVNIAFPP